MGEKFFSLKSFPLYCNNMNNELLSFSHKFFVVCKILEQFSLQLSICDCRYYIAVKCIVSDFTT